MFCVCGVHIDVNLCLYQQIALLFIILLDLAFFIWVRHSLKAILTLKLQESNYTYHGEPLVMYIIVELLCFTSKTNTVYQLYFI